MVTDVENAFINNQHLTVYSIERYVKAITGLILKCESIATKNQKDR
jgi:hypothetical protein